ncbi:plasmid mobilization protein [Thiomonas intermedia]|uniref:plasmid mobilization protein n=1 Tax=Thiomonas intermedia TaxID=926 RepID=UPI0009A4F492|nr:plasmid mobilization relaxosome protein MobC [Thiomonas intermedia]
MPQHPRSLIARRRRHGPEPLPASDLRSHCVSVRLNPAELALLDAKRGRLARGEWMRAAALHHLPPAPPNPIAREQWQQLARVGANLNQIAAAVNAARLSGAMLPDLADIRGALVELRSALITARNDLEDTA